MRLIDINACSLIEPYIVELIQEADVRRATGVKPGYAILSHRWDREEVTFKDLEKDTWTTKQGARKLLDAIRIARSDGHAYLWVDTCCIDKDSSSELSEAINSMFRWYAESEVCYAYLNDFAADAEARRTGGGRFNEEFSKSAWFTRGWTLQELLAPAYVHFYSSSWCHFGTKRDLASVVALITKVPVEVLYDPSSVWSHSVATRMSWASERLTDRPEDIAYCLMGLFAVHMPLLYGEGVFLAFQRLQEEILKRSGDHSLFAWRKRRSEMDAFAHLDHGLLADHPFDFVDSSGIRPYDEWRRTAPWSMTNKGLQIELGFLNAPFALQAVLLCAPNCADSGFITVDVYCAIPQSGQYHRIHIDRFATTAEEGVLRQVYFRRNSLEQSAINTTWLSPMRHVCLKLATDCTGDKYRAVAATCRFSNSFDTVGQPAIGATWTSLILDDVLVPAGRERRKYITIPKWQPGLHFAILFKVEQAYTDVGSDVYIVLLIGHMNSGELGYDIIDYPFTQVEGGFRDLSLREFGVGSDGATAPEWKLYRPIDFSKEFKPHPVQDRVRLGLGFGVHGGLRCRGIESLLSFVDNRQSTANSEVVQIQFSLIPQ